ncbi:amino acid adenylation domain-containing protein [Streptomyces sp. CHA1]|uniref:non-ribosomal peptide synthetase n=4 Tax=Streptomyces TaxID=1883 RepID=UPI0020958791|nr:MULTISPECIES: non-ribosomal peptide synthetase [unclassified Streptomyces]MCO6704257.1 amino acid adenylation domain-containing protein [Streptomyces sp. CHB9.2]MCO6710530.1 amino acid adenylation domain-containing protein [Streptomyces sp. CHA3]MCO6716326.1 amino acid adenylation domain-containing protein [Streptomyces sp. CHB19.2]MCO6728147.1 amino acid adenylation domain-containing protein [Streptomyces sp. CHA16]MCO6734254.1 amino acid adenylation domain-containing protein [Streptomyces
MLTFSELLQERARSRPADEAFTFHQAAGATGEPVAHRVDYAGLDRAARAVAQQLGDTRGERALLLYPPGPEYIAAFFGCLYAGVLAVPVYPPDLARWERSLGRIRAIARDSGARLALTTEELVHDVRTLSQDFPELRELSWLGTGGAEDSSDSSWHPVGVRTDEPAFLQYTSGSTADPKGVVLTHANLLHNTAAIADAFALHSGSRGAIWLPPYHDMGLIGGILAPVRCGFPVSLMSPQDFLQDPFSWLKLISDTGATCSGGPNFAYELCVRRTTPEQRAQLDLSAWELAFCGAEPIRPDTVETFLRAFEPSGLRRSAFYPCYGLAESTLIVAGPAKGAEPSPAVFDRAALTRNEAVRAVPGTTAAASAPGPLELVGVGAPVPGLDVAVVDPRTGSALPDGRVGELWVIGGSVAHGYWNAPEATEEVFGASLPDRPGTRWLRTGDLGFRSDGELFISGRRKDVLIVRGRNHFPQEIEQAAEAAHPGLRPGCSAAVQTADGRLVLVAEVRPAVTAPETPAIVVAVRAAVGSTCQILLDEVALVGKGSVPKTSSGKIQRSATREAYEQDKLPRILPAERGRSAVGGVLGQLSALITELGGVAASPDADGGPVEHGLDSLAVVAFRQRLESDLGVHIPLADLMACTSLKALAERVERMERAPGTGAARPADADAGRPEPGAVTHGERALWLLDRLTPGDPAYTVARAVRLRGPLDPEAVRNALQQLIDRHEALRASFETVDGTPVRVVHPHRELAWATAAGGPEERARFLEQQAAAPFDLARGPLLRAALFEEAADSRVLLIAVHHIVADHWSLSLLSDELAELLAAARNGGQPALAPAAPHSVYAGHEQAYLDSPAFEEDWAYWQRQLAGPLPELRFPAEPAREGSAEAGDRVQDDQVYELELSSQLSADVERLARDHGVTVFTTLLSAFQTLLHRTTGTDDIVVGTHVADRTWPGAEAAVGYCLNTVPLRVGFADDPSFRTLLQRTAGVVTGALEHHRFPFDLMVGRLAPERRSGRTPLVQVSFGTYRGSSRAGADLAPAALNVPGELSPWAGCAAEAVPVAPGRAQFGLSLTMAKVGDRLRGTVAYDRTQVTRATVARLAEQFVHLIRHAVAAPDSGASVLSLLGDGERGAVVAGGRGPVASVRGVSVHGLFEGMAGGSPERLAVRSGDGRAVSYGELDAWASGVAGVLAGRGVGPGDVVGVCLPRSVELVAVLLGVWKAGAAYVPLDPVYPAARTAAVVGDAGPAVVVSRSGVMPAGVEADCPVVLLDEVDISSAVAVPGVSVDPGDLAYVLYTSGSTGVPKGVEIAHRNVLNLLVWAHDTFGVEELSAVAATTSVCFDLSVFELFAPLTCGGSVVLVENALELPAVDERISLVNSVPSAVAELVARDVFPAGVQTVCMAGEPFSSELVGRLRAGGVELVLNLYGPSETTTYSTGAELGEWTRDPVPIGRPIHNTSVVVVDAGLEPVPHGVLGELCIGGSGVARGYRGRPALTADRFLPDPFGEKPGARVYRTGDLVRQHATHLEFVGRVDHQVKVRGFRIELGEIETVLVVHPAVSEAVVQVRTEGEAGRRLVGYVVPAEIGDGGLARALREFLAQRLPSYMVPAGFVFLDRLPRTPNGKVDRGRLPSAERLTVASGDRIPPRNDTEKRVARILAGLLDLPAGEIGIHDNFFELGGNSLLASRLSALLGKEFAITAPLRAIFEAQTVEQLARYAGTAAAPAAAIPRVARTPFQPSASPR